MSHFHLFCILDSWLVIKDINMPALAGAGGSGEGDYGELSVAQGLLSNLSEGLRPGSQAFWRITSRRLG